MNPDALSSSPMWTPLLSLLPFDYPLRPWRPFLHSHSHHIIAQKHPDDASPTTKKAKPHDASLLEIDAAAI